MSIEQRPPQLERCRLDAEIRFLVGRNERRVIERLAQAHGRTMSAECRHAMRLFVQAQKRAQSEAPVR
jgi:hypothetical protein